MWGGNAEGGGKGAQQVHKKVGETFGGGKILIQIENKGRRNLENNKRKRGTQLNEVGGGQKKGLNGEERVTSFTAKGGIEEGVGMD